MVVLRTDIERALDQLAAQEEGMRFQGAGGSTRQEALARVHRPPAQEGFRPGCLRPSSLTPERMGKGLAASLTPTLKKICADAKTAKENFPDLKLLLFDRKLD